ncbi:hypothetical protein [Nocardioides sp.]|uniref:hypothetical protein n=1 Tax=Nocardioides sp. TaxID=35761 RepID=UPI00356A6E41
MPWRGPQVEGEFPTLGHVWADWIEDTLTITDGPQMGQPVRLYDEQVLHLLHRGRIDPNAREADGNDAFKYGGSQLIRGQKWGKDPLIAMVDLLHAFGPCDFAGFDAHGEPVGKPHPSPWIGVAALNDLQANNTWLPLKAMLEASALADLPGVDITLELIRLPCGNPIERLTTTAFGRLGGRFTAVSLTENGLMTATGENGNTGKRSPLSFARTLLRSVSGMGGLWIGASNIWDPTEDSHAQQVCEAKNSATYADVRRSRQHVDLEDDNALREELEYLYGDSLKDRGGHVSTLRLIKDCRDEAMGEAEVRRFFLCEALAGEEQLCAPPRWETFNRTEEGRLLPGEAITLGFDGSRSRDATVLDAVRISDGRVFPLETWLPRCMCVRPDHEPPGCREKKVPALEVEQYVDDLFKAYDVHYLYGDPYKWQPTLEKLAAKHPGKVVEVPTNVETRMDGMVDRFITLRDAGDLTFCDPTGVLTAHVDNTVIVKGRRKPSRLREDAKGVVIAHYRKVGKKRHGLLIDHSVGMLLALDARGQAVEDGALAKQAPPPPVGISGDTPEAAAESLDWNTVPL